MVRKILNNCIKKKMPSFFKIILADYSTDHLRIPPSFLKHIRNELCERATLKLKASSGCSWNVKVIETTRGVYLGDGWQAFLKDNSLGDKEFLVFRYDGKMHFKIQIFNKNGCERVDFPSTETHQNPTSANTKRTHGRPRKSPVISTKHCHPSSTSCTDNSAAGKNLRSCESGEVMESKEEEEDYQDNTAEDWEAAKSFKSKFPHFTRVIRELYSVPVSTSFSREHLFPGKFKASLQNSKGNKTWEVSVVPTCGTHQLCKGWIAFARANQVKLNDVCIFELVRRNKMVVHILRMHSPHTSPRSIFL